MYKKAPVSEYKSLSAYLLNVPHAETERSSALKSHPVFRNSPGRTVFLKLDGPHENNSVQEKVGLVTGTEEAKQETIIHDKEEIVAASITIPGMVHTCTSSIDLNSVSAVWSNTCQQWY